jgi:hypothetical protein
VDRLDAGAGAVTEESEHTAGRNGTGAAVGGRVLTTLPVTRLSLPSPSPAGRIFQSERAFLATTTAARDHRTRRAAPARCTTSLCRPCFRYHHCMLTAAGNSRVRGAANWSRSARFLFRGGSYFVRPGARLDLSFLARACTFFLLGFQEPLLGDSRHIFQGITAVLGR